MFIIIGLGALLAVAGFLRPPKRALDLLLPRFVIPILFWGVTFWPSLKILLFGEDPTQPLNVVYHEQQMGAALVYFLACMVACWTGFLLLPKDWGKGARLTRNFRLRISSPSRVRTVSYWLITGSFVMALLGKGPALFNENWGASPVGEYPVIFYITTFLVPASATMAAVIFGLVWPSDRQDRHLGLYLGGLLMLTLASITHMASFSRGAGVMLPLIVLGYIGGSGRIPVKTLFIAGGFAIYASAVGLSGRGIYGHNGGALLYLKHFFSGEVAISDAFGSGGSATESLTPLCVVMQAAVAGVDLTPMSKIRWLFFQIPVPHIGGLGGSFTLDATIMVGGVGNFGYTATMFGDTFGHFGWLGALAFCYMGALYRLVENIATKPIDLTMETPIIWVVLPATYFAFMAGNFNTFRAWNSSFTFSVGMVVLVFWAIGRMLGSQPHEEQPQDELPMLPDDPSFY
ncbi:MAG: hypothetical protein WCI73_05085 [Phycisphaerae bacterium]